MSQSKVTLDSLTLLSNELRNNAESILSIKDDMDTLLNSFVWDDPVAISFKERYEEGLKPITNKLIPNIENYLGYISQLGGTVEEYSGGSSIHIAGGSGIAQVLPKGSKVDPITIDADAKVHIPDTPIKSINEGFVVPSNEAFAETWELKPGEVVRMDEDLSFEVVPIANGCGTENGFGRWAGQTGAGIDAYMNSVENGSAKVAGAVLVGIATAGVTGGVVALVGISKQGKVMNPDEFKRLNDQACAAHDICYVEGDKLTCDDNFERDGGRFSSRFTRWFGGGAYEDAQREGVESQYYADKIEIESGKKIIVPQGYLLKAVNTKS